MGHATEAPPPPHRERRLVAASLGYPLTWVAGLSVFSASASVSSTGAELLRNDSGHSAPLLLQFLLTQGVAAVFLGMVVLVLADRIGGKLGRVVRLTGLAAVLVSAVQCGIGVAIASVTVPHRNTDSLAALTDTVNRLDGLKMSLLAITWTYAALAARRWPIRSARLVMALFAATAVALLVSAAGYLMLEDVLATAAYVSLPLLIASVTTSALVLYRHPAPRSSTRQLGSAVRCSRLEAHELREAPNWQGRSWARVHAARHRLW